MQIFLFFTHPFDVGDTIRFEDTRYDVNAINLQYVNLEHVRTTSRPFARYACKPGASSQFAVPVI